MENIYKFILNILNAQVGKIASPFFPYVFSVFTIILIANIAGMTLYAFTLTSHILVTFTLGVSSFLGLTILGFYVQKLAFLNFTRIKLWRKYLGPVFPKCIFNKKIGSFDANSDVSLDTLISDLSSIQTN